MSLCLMYKGPTGEREEMYVRASSYTVAVQQFERYLRTAVGRVGAAVAATQIQIVVRGHQR